MKISNVKVKNFRCFQELNVELTKTHALIGENGSGKTSILEAIHMATSPGLPYLDEQDFNNADLGDLSIEVTFDEPFLTRISDAYTTQDIPCRSILMTAHRRERAAPGKALSEPFVVEKYTVPLEYDEQHVPTVRTGEIKVNVPVSVQKTEFGYESPRKTTPNPFKFTVNRLTLQNETVNLPDVFYFDRDREAQAKVGFNSLLQKVAKDLNWRYRKDWNQENIETKWVDFYQEVISTVENPKSDRIIQPIKEKFRKIVGIDVRDLELGLLDIEQPFSGTFFSRRTGTNQINQKRFGSGISILLAYFLLEIISKLTKEKMIFLIDEPELHLHPQLQQSLFEEFRESAFQTIYTTQSDCFVNIAEWESISRFQIDHSMSPQSTHLEKNLEGKKISEHLDEIKTWHQHQSIFFKEDNQLFFSRKCLLVEGPAEKYGIPILIQKLDQPLSNFTIISCNGKTKIPYYQLLCKSFGIPFFTLFDLDSQPINENDNDRPGKWADPQSLATFPTNFESLFNISNNSSNKTNRVLQVIDTIQPTNIPIEIAIVLNSIKDWAS